MTEPLTRPSATLSPLRGARGTRHAHVECPSPRLRGEGAAKRRMRGVPCCQRSTIAALLLLFAMVPALADTSATNPTLPGNVGIAQHLDAQLPLDVMLRDETGKVVR